MALPENCAAQPRSSRYYNLLGNCQIWNPGDAQRAHFARSAECASAQRVGPHHVACLRPLAYQQFEAWAWCHWLPRPARGVKDMSPAVDVVERLVIQRKLRHGAHPVQQWCAANAVVTRDPAGGRKFDKAKSSGRIARWWRSRWRCPWRFSGPQSQPISRPSSV